MLQFARDVIRDRRERLLFVLSAASRTVATAARVVARVAIVRYGIQQLPYTQHGEGK